MMKLEFPMVALTLIEKKCYYITALVLDDGLPCVEDYMNIPRVVMYGDMEHQD